MQVNKSSPSSSSSQAPSETGVLFGAAGAGAVASYMTLGIILGPLALVGGAAAGALLTTQQTPAGGAARAVGGAAATMTTKAQKLDEKHDLSGKAKELGKNVVSKVGELDEKHDISGKMKAGLSGAAAKAIELNEKHKISDKLAGGAARAMGSLNNLLGGGNTQSRSAGQGTSI